MASQVVTMHPASPALRAIKHGCPDGVYDALTDVAAGYLERVCSRYNTPPEEIDLESIEDWQEDIEYDFIHAEIDNLSLVAILADRQLDLTALRGQKSATIRNLLVHWAVELLLQRVEELARARRRGVLLPFGPARERSG